MKDFRMTPIPSDPDAGPSGEKQNLLRRYGGNVAGAIYTIACSTEFSTLISQNIGSSILMGFSVGSYLLCGHKRWGVIAGAAFNLAGTLLGIGLDMAHGNVPALIGAAIVCVGLGMVIVGTALEGKYPEFGEKARRYGSYLAAISNLFIAPEKFIAGHIREAIYYALLSVGDLFLSGSQPAATRSLKQSARLSP
jgi:hypothetical protein